MKILGIVCSPRKNGNTEVLVKEVLTSAHGYGAETDIIRVSSLDIKPCDGCESCDITGNCRIKDDMQDVYAKMQEADGIIIGSPVYFWGVSAQAKAIIDRTFVFRKQRQLRNKIGGAVVVARTTGAASAIAALNDFFTLQKMMPARSIGPRTAEELARERSGVAIGYADKRGEVRKHERAMAEAEALGRAMVETIAMVHKV
ncbi:flavodoxin family protein [Chloroflexota bacterium]